MLVISEVENSGVEASVKAFIAVPSVSPLVLITSERTEEAPDALELELPVYAVSEEVAPDAGAVLQVVLRGEPLDELLQLFRILQVGEGHGGAERLGLLVDAGDGRGDRQVEDRLGDLDQVLVGEDAVFAADCRRHALEIERQLDADVLIALVALELLLDVIGGRCLDRAGRGDGRRPAADEIESGGEGFPVRIGEGVGEALRTADASLQHLGDQRRVVDLIAKPIGVQRVGEKTVVADEVLDRRHLADVGLVIGGRVFDRRLGRGHRLVARKVFADGQVLRGGRGHRRSRMSSIPILAPNRCRPVNSLGSTVRLSGTEACFRDQILRARLAAEPSGDRSGERGDRTAAHELEKKLKLPPLVVGARP